MGIQGTEVAKESSDIIILDDNFSSVVKVSLSSKYTDENSFILKEECMFRILYASSPAVVQWFLRYYYS